jgi:two-component system, OmpR family, response regulator RegX3
MSARVLLADPEREASSLVCALLEERGFVVTPVSTGREVLSLAATSEIVLLERLLPDFDGLTLCRLLRSRSSVPVIFLTRQADELSKVAGLEAGADDYVTKPVGAGELVARIRAVLRRTRQQAADGEILRTGRLQLDLDRRELRVDGTPVSLSTKMFELLRMFMQSPGRVLTRSSLIQKVWGDQFMGDAKTLDVHVRWLRRKIQDDGETPQHLFTVRGVGYRFEAGPRAPSPAPILPLARILDLPHAPPVPSSAPPEPILAAHVPALTRTGENNGNQPALGRAIDNDRPLSSEERESRTVALNGIRSRS